MKLSGADRAHYDRPRDWSELDPSNSQRVEQTQALVPPDTRSILDVGCGAGAVTNKFADDGLHVVGLDGSKVRLEHFRGEALHGPLERLAEIDERFDVVICAEVLEHLPRQLEREVRTHLERLARHAVITSTPYREPLTTNEARCFECGHRFHTSLHVRSYTKRRHRRLFRSMTCDHIEFIESTRWWPIKEYVRTKILGAYKEYPDRHCPQCNGRTQGFQDLSKIRQKLVYHFDTMTRPFKGVRRPVWILSVHKR